MANYAPMNPPVPFLRRMNGARRPSSFPTAEHAGGQLAGRRGGQLLDRLADVVVFHVHPPVHAGGGHAGGYLHFTNSRLLRMAFL